ncbi:MAG: GNAT family N-acetyltransferase [Agriterribacter sp.]
MTVFSNAIKDDFEPLLKLIVNFELDKQVSFDKSDKLDARKLLKENRKNLKKFITDKNCKYILCRQDGILNGYIFLSYDDNIYVGEGYINEVYVVPTQRRKGIAKRLLQKGLIWLKQRNCKTIDITVNKKNKPAIELYKHFGFDKFDDNYISMRKKG